MHKKIAVITCGNSDFLEILRGSSAEIIVMKPEEIGLYDLNSMHSIAILGGTQEKPLLFRPRERVVVEKFLESGKKVFSEYCSSIGNIYCAQPVSTRFDRLIYCGEEDEDIDVGDILDDQCSTRIMPYACSSSRPILQYGRPKGHSKTTIDENFLSRISDRALWFDNPDNLLVCCFRISNFVKARFAPVAKWRAVIKSIVDWLCDEDVDVVVKSVYRFKEYDESIPFERQVKDCFDRAVNWFIDSDMLIDDGRNGVMEGLGTEIYPDGEQRIIRTVRADCTAETSLVFFMKYYLDSDMRSKYISDNLMSVCFDFMQCKEGIFKGMLRWTQDGWGVCYQDDSARVLISQLLICLYTGKKAYLEECMDALDFLVRTTGTDGLRVARTDNIGLTKEGMKRLAETPANFISAHYNAYYLGALLLVYKITGREVYKEVGIRGLETIMAHYPNTRREMSETQEICRLIMPLAWLYWITGDPKHKGWLYQVTKDLVRLKHASGAYLEWDTGYKADRYGAGEGEESTLLTKNGDPVVDLLYSLNWLPMAFSQAYFVTKDPYFKELWMDIAKFFMSTQIHSENKMINGAWARAMDVELMEIYGINADIGWGPWAIETGWMVSTIGAGLAAGLLSDRLMQFYE